MKPETPERRGLPGSGDVRAALAAEQGDQDGFVAVAELEATAEWRDRRQAPARRMGVTGRLRALLGTKNSP